MNDLQNIKLPGFLVTDWYKNHLILSEQEKKEVVQSVIAPKAAVKEEGKPWYQGENKGNITIVVSQQKDGIISSDWLTFLGNVLTACKLSIQDVVVVNIAIKSISYQQIREQFKSKTLLVFDVAPSLIGIPAVVPEYEIRVDNNCAIMFSESIDIMLPNTTEAKQTKMKLWTSLKKIFNV